MRAQTDRIKWPLTPTQVESIDDALQTLYKAIRVLSAPVVPTKYADRTTLPLEGMTAVFTDSSTATWGATIAGAGTNRVFAYFNGITWTVAGK